MNRAPTQLPRVLVSGLVLAAFGWACGLDSESGDPEQATPAAAPASTSVTSGGPGPVTTPDRDAAKPDPTTIDGDATEPNLKVAFIGDTGTGSDFKSVLQLIKREAADVVLIQGDLNYSLFGSAGTWFDAIDDEINSTWPGSKASVTIPYIVSKGNHDTAWGSGYGPGLKTRMGQWGITPTSGDPTTKNYSVVYKGLKIVMVDEAETSPTRASYVEQSLQGDKHLWKICAWHKNQRNSNVGPKSDEMGWEIYENCRAQGAIVAQAHSHTYSRSKTLTNTTNQTVDSTCSDPFALCVGPGKHFFFDSSLGGEDTRSLENENKPHWASAYTGSFGALFIEFNVNGDPKMAQGYFKTTNDVVIDPPASSGKTRFTITRTP